MSLILDELKYVNGLVQAVVQDVKSRDVLMCAYMNKDSLKKTIDTGYAHYWSRSRKKLWKKGESSGNIQIVHQILIDCDMDSILLLVEQKGGACHKGYTSCFYRDISGEIVGTKLFEPDDVYGNV
ncbi:phosphoribosyl-AMP cyclohydrolase [Methanosalsum natronophilum]|uniref:Phosphoribosyl-AMP cyclohydrolase n=1 Tax=Methanosalsum natronophilum TaxID=768733 RepID=A0A424YUY9_9EURY|nr:phosphoribosyl-AMP cyclohydrolase [Methanosalsum natronophilum]MCS3924335.1 phosphoribosyl-AMP cyclohydrolase [Methanosalsum natronophilum]RQD82951.1 MAG: phosphoribosyl-AMP cyclohydrolase [Methanosalsum natronophilum]